MYDIRVEAEKSRRQIIGKEVKEEDRVLSGDHVQ